MRLIPNGISPLNRPEQQPEQKVTDSSDEAAEADLLALKLIEEIVEMEEINFDSDKGFACPDCEKRCQTEPGLKKHMNTMHKSVSGKFPCSKCPKSYQRQSELNRHMKTSQKCK